MATKVSKRNYCLQIQYCSALLYLCTNLSCNKASNPWRTWPSYSTTMDSYVIHISEDEKKKISYTFNVLLKNISTLRNPNKVIQRGSKVWRERKNQQDATIRCLLSTSVSTCFGHHYAHLQENKDRVTAFGVLLWFCCMWLVAVVGHCVVGCEHIRSRALFAT